MHVSDLHFLGPHLSTGTGEIRFNCPFCPDHGKGPDTKFHMYVNPRRGKWFCHRHGHGGDLKNLLRRFDEGDVSGPPCTEVDEIFDAFLLGGATPDAPACPHPDVLSCMSTESIRYLEERGLTAADIDHYGIMEGDGRMRGRVIVPEYRDGVLVCWVGRAFRDIEPRYLNAPGETRRGAVFNLENLADRSDRVIITEGVFDAMAAGRDAVATYGKYCSPIQLGRIASKKFKRHYVALDPDAPESQQALCRLLWSWCGTVTIDYAAPTPTLISIPSDVRLVRMPDGEDPSSLGHARFREFLSQAVPYHPDKVDLWAA